MARAVVDKMVMRAVKAGRYMATVVNGEDGGGCVVDTSYSQRLNYYPFELYCTVRHRGGWEVCMSV